MPTLTSKSKTDLQFATKNPKTSSLISVRTTVRRRAATKKISQILSPKSQLSPSTQSYSPLTRYKSAYEEGRITVFLRRIRREFKLRRRLLKLELRSLTIKTLKNRVEKLSSRVVCKLLRPRTRVQKGTRERYRRFRVANHREALPKLKLDSVKRKFQQQLLFFVKRTRRPLPRATSLVYTKRNKRAYTQKSIAWYVSAYRSHLQEKRKRAAFGRLRLRKKIKVHAKKCRYEPEVKIAFRHRNVMRTRAVDTGRKYRPRRSLYFSNFRRYRAPRKVRTVILPPAVESYKTEEWYIQREKRAKDRYMSMSLVPLTEQWYLQKVYARRQKALDKLTLAEGAEYRREELREYVLGETNTPITPAHHTQAMTQILIHTRRYSLKRRALRIRPSKKFKSSRDMKTIRTRDRKTISKKEKNKCSPARKVELPRARQFIHPVGATAPIAPKVQSAHRWVLPFATSRNGAPLQARGFSTWSKKGKNVVVVSSKSVRTVSEHATTPTIKSSKALPARRSEAPLLSKARLVIRAAVQAEKIRARSVRRVPSRLHVTWSRFTHVQAPTANSSVTVRFALSLRQRLNRARIRRKAHKKRIRVVRVKKSITTAGRLYWKYQKYSARKAHKQLVQKLAVSARRRYLLIRVKGCVRSPYYRNIFTPSKKKNHKPRLHRSTRRRLRFRNRRSATRQFGKLVRIRFPRRRTAYRGKLRRYRRRVFRARRRLRRRLRRKKLGIRKKRLLVRRLRKTRRATLRRYRVQRKQQGVLPRLKFRTTSRTVVRKNATPMAYGELQRKTQRTQRLLKLQSRVQNRVIYREINKLSGKRLVRRVSKKRHSASVARVKYGQVKRHPHWKYKEFASCLPEMRWVKKTTIVRPGTKLRELASAIADKDIGKLRGHALVSAFGRRARRRWSVIGTQLSSVYRRLSNLRYVEPSATLRKRLKRFRRQLARHRWHIKRKSHGLVRYYARRAEAHYLDSINELRAERRVRVEAFHQFNPLHVRNVKSSVPLRRTAALQMVANKHTKVAQKLSLPGRVKRGLKHAKRVRRAKWKKKKHSYVAPRMQMYKRADKKDGTAVRVIMPFDKLYFPGDTKLRKKLAKTYALKRSSIGDYPADRNFTRKLKRGARRLRRLISRQYSMKYRLNKVLDLRKWTARHASSIQTAARGAHAARWARKFFARPLKGALSITRDLGRLEAREARFVQGGAQNEKIVRNVNARVYAKALPKALSSSTYRYPLVQNLRKAPYTLLCSSRSTTLSPVTRRQAYFKLLQQNLISPVRVGRASTSLLGRRSRTKRANAAFKRILVRTAHPGLWKEGKGYGDAQKCFAALGEYYRGYLRHPQLTWSSDVSNERTKTGASKLVFARETGLRSINEVVKARRRGILPQDFTPNVNLRAIYKAVGKGYKLGGGGEKITKEHVRKDYWVSLKKSKKAYRAHGRLVKQGARDSRKPYLRQARANLSLRKKTEYCTRPLGAQNRVYLDRSNSNIVNAMYIPTDWQFVNPLASAEISKKRARIVAYKHEFPAKQTSTKIQPTFALAIGASDENGANSHQLSATQPVYLAHSLPQELQTAAASKELITLQGMENLRATRKYARRWKRESFGFSSSAHTVRAEHPTPRLIASWENVQSNKTAFGAFDVPMEAELTLYGRSAPLDKEKSRAPSPLSANFTFLPKGQDAGRSTYSAGEQLLRQRGETAVLKSYGLRLPHRSVSEHERAFRRPTGSTKRWSHLSRKLAVTIQGKRNTRLPLPLIWSPRHVGMNKLLSLGKNTTQQFRPPLRARRFEVLQANRHQSVYIGRQKLAGRLQHFADSLDEQANQNWKSIYKKEVGIVRARCKAAIIAKRTKNRDVTNLSQGGIAYSVLRAAEKLHSSAIEQLQAKLMARARAINAAATKATLNQFGFDNLPKSSAIAQDHQSLKTLGVKTALRWINEFSYLRSLLAGPNRQLARKQHQLWRVVEAQARMQRTQAWYDRQITEESAEYVALSRRIKKLELQVRDLQKPVIKIMRSLRTALAGLKSVKPTPALPRYAHTVTFRTEQNKTPSDRKSYALRYQRSVRRMSKLDHQVAGYHYKYPLNVRRTGSPRFEGVPLAKKRMSHKEQRNLFLMNENREFAGLPAIKYHDFGHVGLQYLFGSSETGYERFRRVYRVKSPTNRWWKIINFENPFGSKYSRSPLHERKAATTGMYSPTYTAISQQREVVADPFRLRRKRISVRLPVVADNTETDNTAADGGLWGNDRWQALDGVSALPNLPYSAQEMVDTHLQLWNYATRGLTSFVKQRVQDIIYRRYINWRGMFNAPSFISAEQKGPWLRAESNHFVKQQLTHLLHGRFWVEGQSREELALSTQHRTRVEKHRAHLWTTTVLPKFRNELTGKTNDMQEKGNDALYSRWLIGFEGWIKRTQNGRFPPNRDFYDKARLLNLGLRHSRFPGSGRRPLSYDLYLHKHARRVAPARLRRADRGKFITARPRSLTNWKTKIAVYDMGRHLRLRRRQARHQSLLAYATRSWRALLVHRRKHDKTHIQKSSSASVLADKDTELTTTPTNTTYPTNYAHPHAGGVRRRFASLPLQVQFINERRNKRRARLRQEQPRRAAKMGLLRAAIRCRFNERDFVDLRKNLSRRWSAREFISRPWKVRRLARARVRKAVYGILSRRALIGGVRKSKSRFWMAGVEAIYSLRRTKVAKRHVSRVGLKSVSRPRNWMRNERVYNLSNPHESHMNRNCKKTTRWWKNPDIADSEEKLSETQSIQIGAFKEHKEKGYYQRYRWQNKDRIQSALTQSTRRRVASIYFQRDKIRCRKFYLKQRAAADYYRKAKPFYGSTLKLLRRLNKTQKARRTIARAQQITHLRETAKLQFAMHQKAQIDPTLYKKGWGGRLVAQVAQQAGVAPFTFQKKVRRVQKTKQEIIRELIGNIGSKEVRYKRTAQYAEELMRLIPWLISSFIRRRSDFEKMSKAEMHHLIASMYWSLRVYLNVDPEQLKLTTRDYSREVLQALEEEIGGRQLTQPTGREERNMLRRRFQPATINPAPRSTRFHQDWLRAFYPKKHTLFLEDPEEYANLPPSTKRVLRVIMHRKPSEWATAVHTRTLEQRGRQLLSLRYSRTRPRLETALRTTPRALARPIYAEEEVDLDSVVGISNTRDSFFARAFSTSARNGFAPLVLRHIRRDLRFIKRDRRMSRYQSVKARVRLKSRNEALGRTNFTSRRKSTHSSVLDPRALRQKSPRSRQYVLRLPNAEPKDKTKTLLNLAGLRKLQANSTPLIENDTPKMLIRTSRRVVYCTLVKKEYRTPTGAALDELRADVLRRRHAIYMVERRNRLNNTLQSRRRESIHNYQDWEKDRLAQREAWTKLALLKSTARRTDALRLNPTNENYVVESARSVLQQRRAAQRSPKFVGKDLSAPGGEMLMFQKFSRQGPNRRAFEKTREEFEWRSDEEEYTWEWQSPRFRDRKLPSLFASRRAKNRTQLLQRNPNTAQKYGIRNRESAIVYRTAGDREEALSTSRGVYETRFYERWLTHHAAPGLIAREEKEKFRAHAIDIAFDTTRPKVWNYFTLRWNKRDRTVRDWIKHTSRWFNGRWRPRHPRNPFWPRYAPSAEWMPKSVWLEIRRRVRKLEWQESDELFYRRGYRNAFSFSPQERRRTPWLEPLIYRRAIYSTRVGEYRRYQFPREQKRLNWMQRVRKSLYPHRRTRQLYIKGRRWPRLRMYNQRMFRGLFDLRNKSAARRHFRKLHRQRPRSVNRSGFAKSLKGLSDRLDNILMQLRLAPTIFWAREIAPMGALIVNGEAITDPAQRIAPGSEIRINHRIVNCIAPFFQPPIKRHEKVKESRKYLPYNYPKNFTYIPAFDLLVYNGLPTEKQLRRTGRINPRLFRWFALDSVRH